MKEYIMTIFDIDTNIEYKRVKNTLEKLREPSEEFLNKAICLEKKLNNSNFPH